MSMALPSRGSLAETPFPEVFAALTLNKATGKLEVSKGKVKRVVVMDGGCVVAISSNALSDSFGRVLESARRIDADTAQRIRVESHGAGLSQEDWVLQQGLMSAAEVEKYLQVQAQVRLTSLMGWSDGTFRFLPLDKVKEAGGLPGFPAPRVVLKALRRQAADPHLRMGVIRRTSEAPQLAADPPYELSTLGLSDAELALARRFDGRATVGEVLMTPGLDPSDVMTLVYGLYVTGMIFVGREAPSPRRAGSAPARPARVTPPAAMAVPAPAAMAVPAPAAMAVPAPAAMAVPPPPAAMAVPAPAARVAPPPPAVVSPPPPAVVAAPPPRVEAAPPPPAPEWAAARPVSPPSPPPAAVMASSAGSGGGGAVSALDFIDAMIAEEVGEFDGEIPVAAKARGVSPLLGFSMAGFSEAEIALAERFKADFQRMGDENHFELLGVDRQAGSADVRKAYFKLVGDYHPDKLVGKPEAIRKLGLEIFNTIQSAYDTLTDADKRAEYVATTFYGRKTEEAEEVVATVELVFKADTFYKQGIGVLNSGDVRGAHRAFEQAVEIYPNEPEYRACLGYTTFALNYPRNKDQWLAGETMISEALKENAKLDRGNYFMGVLNQTKGNVPLARKYFVRALKVNPKNVDALKAYQRIKNQPQEEEKGVISSLFSSVFKK